MGIDEARVRLAPFQVFDRYEAEGVLTFGYPVNIGNEDRLIVRFSPDTGLVESVEYSID